MKHWHHIVPRHMGGTDDPSNLVELTIEEHAEAHRVLWETYGRWQDKIAWQGLARKTGWTSEEHSKAISEAKGCEYRITSAEGEVITVHGLKQWASEQGIDYSFARTGAKTGKIVKGFRIEQLSKVKWTGKPVHKPSKNYQVVTPTGETLMVNNLSKFARENNLNRNTIGGELSRKNGEVTYKGYRIQAA